MQPGGVTSRLHLGALFLKTRARRLHAFFYPDLNNSVLAIEQSFDLGLLVDFPRKFVLYLYQTGHFF
jgi:hypothetical protein